jgi:hypothetical protein
MATTKDLLYLYVCESPYFIYDSLREKQTSVVIELFLCLLVKEYLLTYFWTQNSFRKEIWFCYKIASLRLLR